MVDAVRSKFVNAGEAVFLNGWSQQIEPAVAVIHEIKNWISVAECLVNKFGELACCVDVSIARRELEVAGGIASELY